MILQLALGVARHIVVGVQILVRFPRNSAGQVAQLAKRLGFRFARLDK